MNYKLWIKELKRLKTQYWDLHDENGEPIQKERTKLYLKPYMVVSYLVSWACIYHLLGTPWKENIGIIIYLVRLMGAEDIMLSLGIIAVLLTAQASIFLGNYRWIARISIFIQIIFLFTMLSYVLIHVSGVNEYITRAGGSTLLLLSSIVFGIGTFLKKAEK